MYSANQDASPRNLYVYPESHLPNFHVTLARELADCQATTPVYLQSVAYCLKDKCFAEPWHKVEHYWLWLQTDRDSRWPALLDSIPSTVPPLAPVGNKYLNSTPLRVQDAAYDYDYATAQAFAWNERWHERMSYILVFVTLGALVLGAIPKLTTSSLRRPYKPLSFCSGKLATWFQKHLVMPAMFNNAQRTPVFGGLGYLPSRMMLIFLSFFVVSTAIANSVPYKSVQPNNWAVNRRQEMMGFVANRAGLISFALMPVTILLSARNSPLLWITGWDTSTMIILHRWVARMCAFQAVIHSVGWTIQWRWNTGDYSQFMSEGAMPYMQWGFLATVIICLMVGFAMLPFRKWSYEIFLILHILFAAFLIVGCYYHMIFRFEWRYGYLNWIYVAVGIWVADRMLRGLSVWKNSLQGSVGQTKGTAIAELIPNSTQSIIKLTVFPRLVPNQVKPGTHYFAYFPTIQSWRPWENHPFSVARWVLSESDAAAVSSDAGSTDVEKGQPVPNAEGIIPSITMLIKPHRGKTLALLNHLQSNTGASQVDIPVSFEGPYGEPHPLHLYDNIVLFAGGIGITPALAYTQDLNARGKHSTLIWASRDSGLIKTVRDLLPDSVDAKIFYTGVGETATAEDAPQLRPNIGAMIQEELALDRAGRTAFFVCGPPEMVDQVRTACVNALGNNGVTADRIGFYEESFAW
ncbi:Ferric reductase like transmembrane component [Ceratobasidium sp. AG-Ba]|nr:Ferric reductase like transmembrane component [Ceratobasidium sp. AG-Ba]QRV99655.1 Ferric reductase like transmembrane component [Ceratobasidium sp. AG-Ba]QRW14189.1 Ferric reductase like transmembrane component [Ceratobasidium sp. AG-Ba]